MTYTDSNIPMHCGECDEYTEGVHEMFNHIELAHKNYTSAEAAQYANQWAEDAFEALEVAEMEHSDDHRRKACSCDKEDL